MTIRLHQKGHGGDSRFTEQEVDAERQLEAVTWGGRLHSKGRHCPWPVTKPAAQCGGPYPGLRKLCMEELRCAPQVGATVKVTVLKRQPTFSYTQGNTTQLTEKDELLPFTITWIKLDRISQVK